MSVPPKAICMNKPEALAYIQGDFHMSPQGSDTIFVDTIDILYTPSTKNSADYLQTISPKMLVTRINKTHDSLAISQRLGSSNKALQVTKSEECYWPYFIMRLALLFFKLL
ncbi:hypothetical protein RclHR1_04060004 [Rhizophagus clarus]|uniref:Uncharacterized protein n=1 Tax=Rhizophagus clarus TaxID=94130 RepID=A0A2Z6REM5_9GLOM|nr:hypothetical protein RclHR1_04060004 [Rhizophagus clarus]